MHPGSYQRGGGVWGGPATYGAKDLSDFFEHSTNISFKWLFFNNTDADVFNKLVKYIPLGLIMRNMENLAQPVYSEFVETNRDKDFMEIAERFYRELFWNETIFVSFDFFKNPEIYEIEGDEPPELEYFREVGGFDTWVKVTLNEYDKDTRFMHLATSITVEIPKWREHLVRARWSGNHMNNFINWFEYSLEYCISLKKLVNFSNMMIKRIEVTGTNSIRTYLEDLAARLETVETFYLTDERKRLDVVPKVFATGQDLRELHYVTFNLLDRRAFELGRVSNTNPKGERLTAGENYKDITSIANRQRAVLSQLELFASKVSDMWGIDLAFAVNGLPERERLEMDNATAPNPNVETTAVPTEQGSGAVPGGSH